MNGETFYKWSFKQQIKAVAVLLLLLLSINSMATGKVMVTKFCSKMHTPNANTLSRRKD